ncbi:purine-nucleoside phosphorylase [Bengtsoniella intestinalis]|uniref:purine-nucleoside phosphorylase n=1 Tax=Bengtsoniella intestinalis TaxID=3073143 RepID=UPI00391F48D7
MEQIQKRIDLAVDYIRSCTNRTPTMGLILGSGLGDFANTLDDAVIIPFGEITGFPVPSVEGHAGNLVFGNHNGKAVVALSGRVHYYEGLPQQEITIPTRVLAKLGVKTLLLTNAAGGVNLDFSAGALMLISDHINFSGQNPLLGKNMDEFGPRFPDMSDVYTKTLRQSLKVKALDAGIALEEGVYAMYAGPNYETPAEIRMLRTMGADATGMSTVPEALVAAHAGMQVIGISCITNMAAGVLDQKLDHSEVVETANRVKQEFLKVVSLAIDLAVE